MKGLILLFIFIMLIWCGVQSIIEGDVLSGMILLFFPISMLFGALCYFALEQFFEKPREKREKALCKKYHLPKYVADNDYGALEKKFQEVIAKAIESTSDNAKISDLKHCQRVIKEMNKSCVGSYTWLSSFSKIYKAFRLTGCHLKVTDSEGNNITKII